MNVIEAGERQQTDDSIVDSCGSSSCSLRVAFSLAQDLVLDKDWECSTNPIAFAKLVPKSLEPAEDNSNV
jgi:hypothetical protein